LNILEITRKKYLFT